MSEDIRRFLRKHGFREWRRTRLTSRVGGGRYFEAVFQRKLPARESGGEKSANVGLSR
ncbi:MAG: hypothetical protein ABSD21_08140 [Rhizomicrobium sp.]